MIVKEILDLYSMGKLSLESAFHMLAEQGCCPALLNDDYGNWAIVFDGTQQVPDKPGEPAKIWTSFLVEKESWKKTIQEAFIYSLQESQDEAIADTGEK